MIYFFYFAIFYYVYMLLSNFLLIFALFSPYFPLNFRLLDLLEDANEVQEILGRSYGVGDDIGKTFSMHRCSMHTNMYVCIYM